MINDRFAARFSELQREWDEMPFETGRHVGSHVKSGAWEKWATSAESLIKAACGMDSPYYESFIRARERCTGYESQLRALAGIFRSAKEAFEGGYLFDVEREVSAEIFGDFVVLAKQALAEDNKDVAAVLAAAALEDALKRYAASNGLDVDDASMSKIISALKSKGLVSGAQKSLLTAMLRMRNHAMHAEWEKIEKPDVSGLVGFVEQFLLTHFSRNQ